MKCALKFGFLLPSRLGAHSARLTLIPLFHRPRARAARRAAPERYIPDPSLKRQIASSEKIAKEKFFFQV